MKIRSAGDWQQINSIFDASVSLHASDRAAYLDASCSTDPQLRAEVERLLAASDSAGDFLEAFDGAKAARLLDPFLESPATIGRYKVIRKIASGGMGVVYLVEDTSLRRQVAMKLLPPWLDASQSAKARLLEEARAASAIDHPNVATVHEIGEAEDGRVFITMSYYEGETLRDRMVKRPLSAAEAADIALQTARGLAAAHEKGIIHRDIKPENILVRLDGMVKVLDFGIAAVEAPSLTHTSAAIGTAAYMSPEQTLASPVDSRTDVWSLGVVLYEMLTGARPFRGNTRDEIIAAIRTDPIQVDRQLPEEISANLRAIVDRCLQRDPTARYLSADELVRDLEALAVSASRDPRSRVRLQATSLVAVLVGALVIAGGVQVFKRVNSPGVAPAVTAIAVFPFSVEATDTALARVGRDLASTLSASLDGVGELRTIDAPQVLDRTSAAPSAGDLSELARRSGAGILVWGSLARIGAHVRADAVMRASNDAKPLAHFAATATAENLPALTDSIAWAVLRELSRLGSFPALTEDGITTRSLPALRAFLEGGRLASEYRMRASAAAYARAITADSTFWLAYWRQAWASAFHRVPVDEAITATYLEHLAQLPAPDRLLIEARLTAALTERLALLDSLVTRFPDFWLGWFELGELHMRQAPFAGSALAEASRPLLRAVALNREFVPGWDRLFSLAITQRDTITSARALGELKRLRLDSTSVLDDRFDILLLYRHLDHLARSGGLPDPALAESVSQGLARGGFRPSPNGVPDRMQGGIARYAFHQARIDLAARQIAGGRVQPPFQWHVIANTWAARGAWDSSLVASNRAQPGATPNSGFLAYRLMAIGAWLGALELSTAIGWRVHATAFFDRMPPGERAELAWIDGLLAATKRDTAALSRAREALRLSLAPERAVLDSSLSAFRYDIAGNRQRAVALLLAIEHNRQSLENGHPYLAGVNRLTASKWLLATGDTALAARLLTWHEAVTSYSAPAAHANELLAPFADLARARILEAQGRRDQASQHYKRFLRSYDHPVEAHQGLVDEARAAVTRTSR